MTCKEKNPKGRFLRRKQKLLQVDPGLKVETAPFRTMTTKMRRDTFVEKRKMNFEKGIALYKEGKFDEALEIFDVLIASRTGQAELHLYRGRILTRMGKGEAALRDFDLLIEKEPYNTDYISDRGVVLHLMGRNEEALSELDRAANLDPKNPYRYSSRAFFKDRIGDLKGAIADYETAIELDPEDAVSYNNKGLVEEKMGYRDRSKESFQKSDELTGYKPGQLDKSTSNLPPVGKQPESQVTESAEIEEKHTKVSSNHFWGTIKSLLQDASTRKEFLAFVKTFFSGKKP
jgi:tetratricopeptide (TPR) repeat protein